MNLPDAINASLELGSGFMQVLSIRRLYRDKVVRGVDWRVTAFFGAWGLWNCFYYPHLGQWLSFTGGLGITVANFVWVSMLFYYKRQADAVLKA